VATASPAIVNGLLFPILFISGTFSPIDSGSWLARIASIFPIRHFEEAVFTVFDPRAPAAGIRVEALLVMLVWGIAAVVIAVRGFRWEPLQK
jgi:ABC-2 type transport system permease protein